MADVLLGRSACRFLTAALLASTLLPLAASAEDEPCKGKGDAAIAQKDRPAARAKAVTRAMTACVVQVAMRILEEGRVGSQLSPNDRARALAAVEPRIAKNPGRLMSAHRVLSDRTEGGWVHVELSGKVVPQAVIDVSREAALGLERSAARIGLVVYEAEHVGKRVEVAGHSYFGGQLGRLLHDRRYEVLPVAFDPATEVTLLDDIAALAKRGRTHEVELIIAGELAIIDGDPNAPLAKTRPVTIDGRLQVVEARTGKLRGRVPLKGQIEASTLAKGLARVTSGGLLDQTLAQLEPMLRVEPTRESVEARVVQLSFAGLPSFREGRAIIELLKLISGLSAIDERGFEPPEGRLEVEARWVGPLDELESLIREELAKHRGLAGIAIAGRKPDRLEWAR